jgi:hypothetical protein
MKGADNFGVDHYRPRKRFPELATTYSNLFYCCNCCNSRKSDFWPTADQIRGEKFIPNPCDHVMFEHLQYSRAVIRLKTAAGRHAETILDFNDPDSVAYRRFVLDLIAALEEDRREAIQTITEIDRLMKAFPQRREELESENRSANADLQRIEENLARLAGATN